MKGDDVKVPERVGQDVFLVENVYTIPLGTHATTFEGFQAVQTTAYICSAKIP